MTRDEALKLAIEVVKARGDKTNALTSAMVLSKSIMAFCDEKQVPDHEVTQFLKEVQNIEDMISSEQGHAIRESALFELLPHVQTTFKSSNPIATAMVFARLVERFCTAPHHDNEIHNIIGETANIETGNVEEMGSTRNVQ